MRPWGGPWALGPLGPLWGDSGVDSEATWAPWAPWDPWDPWDQGPGPGTLGTRAQGLGPRDRDQGTGPRARDQGTRAQGPGPRDQGPGQGTRARAKGPGPRARAKGPGPRARDQGTKGSGPGPGGGFIISDPFTNPTWRLFPSIPPIPPNKNHVIKAPGKNNVFSLIFPPAPPLGHRCGAALKCRLHWLLILACSHGP